MVAETRENTIHGHLEDFADVLPQTPALVLKRSNTYFSPVKDSTKPSN